uniref:Retrovirus-related Pol polyprotein from transposon TNT 1-94 n=1 Tax=Tanacetum cinerariifolium TaxID=118510 RepID=A0A6L2N0K7_TANCI|nr:retrovirus-related Pol polyprotein from transposon TNT 1-94 [Tanacetum cinerariifolium]
MGDGISKREALVVRAWIQIHDMLQKLINQLEILGVSLSQEDINLKFLRSLPTEWRTHTLIWRNKIDLEEQSLDDLFNSLKIYEAEVKSSSSASTTTQNIAFVSSSNTDNTNELVSATASVSAVSTKLPVSSLPNMDSLTTTEVFKQKRSLPTMLLWPSHLQVLLLTMRSDESLPPSPIYDRYQSGNGYHAVPSPYIGTFMLPKPDLVFNNAPTDVEIDHPAFNVKLSHTKPDQDLSHTLRPSAPIIEDWVSDSEDEYETKTPHNVFSFVQPTKQVKPPRLYVHYVETSIPSTTSKTVIPKPTGNGKCMNRKACFVYKSLDHLIKDCNYHEKKMAQPTARNHAQRGNHKHYASMSLLNPQRHVVPAAVLTQSKLVSINAVRPVSTVVPKISVISPSQANTIVTKTNSPPRRLINRSPSPKASTFTPKVTTVKAPMVNAAKGVQGKWEWKSKCLVLDHGNPPHALKDKGVIDSGCSRYMTENMSYLSNFKELNGYVAFGGNPKGGKISRKGLENQLSLKVKAIRSDNGTEFKNNDLNLFCGIKGIKREFSVPRTPQKNGIAKRKNRTLIKVARTMLADLLLPIPFGLRQLILLRVLVTKPHNKTLYELLHGRTPSIGFMRPFGCLVTILNTLDSLGKFDEKVDKGFLIGNFVSSKAFRVFNSRTRIVQETLHVNFLENKPNVTGVQDKFDAEKAKEEIEQQYVLFLVWSSGSINHQNTNGDAAFDEKEPEFEGIKPESEVSVSLSSSAQSKKHDDKTKREAKGKSPVDTNTFSAVGPLNAAASPTHGKSSCIDTAQLYNDPNMLELEDITYSDDEDDVGAEADFNNLETSITANVKSAFLYEIIKEEVYVCQPLGFEDPDYLDKIYVDDIIFGLTNKDLCKAFEKLMKDKFQMSSMGELTFFLGLQVKQKKDKIFISQDKHVVEILRKFGLADGKSASTPIDTKKPLLKDHDDEDELASLDQMVSGKDSSNPLMADNLPKIVWYSTHHVALMKSWLVQKQTTLGQTTTGKEISNPFMAGVNTPRSDEDRLKLMELTVFLLPSDEKVGVEVSAVDLQFWTSVVVKKVNDVTRLQALVDKKKVVIMEASIRDALRLDDAEGTECLPNKEIFAELAKIGYEKPSTKLTFYKAFFLSQWKFLIHTILQCMSAKRTSWDEFSSSMASAVICLSTGRKFNFSKKQVDDLSSHSTKYTSSALTQKVFANMRRVGKGFSGVDTPLFEDMLVVQEVGEGDADEVHVEDVNAARVATEGVVSAADDKLERRNKASKLKRLKKVRSAQRIDTSDDTVMDDVSKLEGIIANIDANEDVVLADAKDVAVEKSADVEDNADIQGRKAKSQAEIYKIDLEHAKNIITKVVTAASDIITAASTTITAASTTITAADVPIVATLTLTVAPSRRRKGVVIRDPQETATPSTIIHSEAKSKDKGKGILIEEPKPLKKQAQIKQDEKYARELEAELNKNIDWDEVIDHVNVAGFKMDYFKGMTYDDIRLIFEKHFDSNVAFLQMTKEKMDEEDNRVLKRLNESQKEKVAKKQKLNEEVPVVDYEIYNENNKPYYKIKRAYGSDQLYLSFLSLLRNFDREDLEALWSLVTERFATTKPENFSDDFQQITLRAMFEKPDIHAQIWKNQRSVHGQAKVKSWKLLESCGVQIITFTTTQWILLVERRYPLTRFTLDQMLNNVRLKVEKESEVSLELLRFIRQQHQEGAQLE